MYLKSTNDTCISACFSPYDSIYAYKNTTNSVNLTCRACDNTMTHCIYCLNSVTILLKFYIFLSYIIINYFIIKFFFIIITYLIEKVILYSVQRQSLFEKQSYCLYLELLARY